jgi:small-conductance mechanosensitive channel/CRP-like cAMP-binding protein
LLVAFGLAVAALVAIVVVRNRTIRRRLRFTLAALLALSVLHLASVYVPNAFAGFTHERAIEQLLIALALINALVTLLFNPWFHDRVPDRSPAIVQDTLVVAVFGAAAVFVLPDSKFLTASAIAAAAIGFALQDTLGNAFSGLAIQVEKPFRVGHWIAAGAFEGLVVEVTWRATKFRTKAGNLVVVPNNAIAKEAITNYSEPSAPTRLFVDVGAHYSVPPNEVEAALLAAMRQVPRVLQTPKPDVLLQDFAASAITYRARFWIVDYAEDEYARDEVHRAVYYEFRRRGLEIPWPIQVWYNRTDIPTDSPERREGFARTIAGVSVMADLDSDTHRAMAEAAHEHLFADGETIVREGEPGDSMFLVRRGRVVITVGGSPDTGRGGTEVAVTEAGGYFGEMSLLTGESRTATVTARGDCTVLEIKADAFRAYVKSHPGVIEQLAASAAARRRELDESRAAQSNVRAPDHLTLVQRMRHFFGLTQD